MDLAGFVREGVVYGVTHLAEADLLVYLVRGRVGEIGVERAMLETRFEETSTKSGHT